MSQPEKYVNLIPHTRIKKEKLPELVEDTVHCRLCPKGFASIMALNNHAKIEHVDTYIAGDPSAWTAVKEEPKQINNAEFEAGNNEIVFEVDMMDNVSYIVLGVDDDRKKKKCSKKKIQNKEVKVKKEAEPITGPFECLQPSATVPDGVCHQIFFSCCEYSVHHRDEHAKRRKGFRCQVCEKPLVCSGEELAPFPCEICGVGFQTSEELLSHRAINHVKVKPYECNICHKKFTQQGGVVQHMRMHTGDRPFPCTFCPKSFTQKSGLDQHLRTHTKVKPYRCILCNKSFRQSVHLKQHMRTHTNVAPFQCGLCEKRFKQSSHLSFHLRSHNPSLMSDEQRVKYKEIIDEIDSQGQGGMDLVEDMGQVEESQYSQDIVEMDLLTRQQDVKFESVIIDEPQIKYEI